MSDDEIQQALAGEIPIEDLSEADQEHVRAVNQLARERHDELLAEYRATKYTFRIEWAEDVLRWRAACDQLHGVFHLDTTPEAAIRGVIAVVGEIVKNNQEWFWSPEWQAGEREVDEAVERGEVETFDSGEEFLHHLDQVAAEGDREAVADTDEGTDTDIHRTVPTDATVDWVKSDSFVTGTSTIYLVALPVHQNPGYDVQIQRDLGYFLDPHEAAAEARRRLEFQVEHAPVEHRHNFAVSGAQVIPVSPNGYPSGLPLRPWSVRLARKGDRQ